MKNICVYCGSGRGRSGKYFEAADSLAEILLKKEIGLIYGGASVGVMGRIADTVLKSGGTVVGVIPEHLSDMEVAHKNLSELHVVSTMHERKAEMINLADGFIALPGGFGTLEELFEVLTWSQLNIHNKPVGLLNTDGFYDKLLDFLDTVVHEQFLRQEHKNRLLVDSNPERLLKKMEEFKSIDIEKWWD